MRYSFKKKFSLKISQPFLNRLSGKVLFKSFTGQQ
jgi:hypothetical protein